MKGIILAGGSGTRLYPITEGVSKQLVPVYDKPMIYYPLSVLMEAGIQDILVITTVEDQDSFKRLLGDGSQFGIHLYYEVQPSPDGLAQAFIIGKDFIGDDECAMVLGDNIFYGSGLRNILKEAVNNAKDGFATIFGYQVRDPERFGIMEIDESESGTYVVSVEEKPKKPKSDYAITGLYFYPKGVSKMASLVQPSARGELEITTLNEMYLKKGILKASLLGEGYTWFDTGTFDSLIDAANMVRTIQNNRDSVICCPEYIGYANHWIDDSILQKRSELLKKNSYGQYLHKILSKKKFLVTGYHGQLGYDIVRELKKRGYHDYLALGREDMDIIDKDKVMQVILDYQPDVIFHCAAWTQVDKAEDMVDDCHQVNVVGTKNIVDASLKVGAKIIYVSTDYVFDGTKEGLYTEEDEVHPMSMYGVTKYEGEEEVRRNPKHYITRVSWLFGIQGHNFIKTMLKLSKNHDKLSVVDDQIGSPTYTVDLARLLVDMALTNKYGTYHATNEEYCSWAEFADYIFKSNDISTKVKPVSTEEYLEISGTKQAYRPRNSKLSKEKLKNAGFDLLPSWKDAVMRYFVELNENDMLENNESGE